MSSWKVISCGVIAGILVKGIFEHNKKSVNDINLSTFASGIYTFDENQVGILDKIASQCPLTGGNAVFQARGMLKLVFGNINYNDDINCLSAQSHSEENDHTVSILAQKNNLNVFPNPTDGIITLRLDYPTDESTKVEIFNLSGKSITEIFFPLGKNEVNINMFNLGIESGTYFYKCNTSANSFKGKIIFIK